MLKPSKDDPNHAEEQKRFEKDNGTWGGDIQKNEKFVPPPQKEGEKK